MMPARWPPDSCVVEGERKSSLEHPPKERGVIKSCSEEIRTSRGLAKVDAKPHKKDHSRVSTKRNSAVKDGTTGRPKLGRKP